MTVLGRPREVYDRSIDVHMSNLRQKLQQASGDASLIETVRGFGYRLRQGS
jgi:two-component system OmpR family response regulator